MTSLSIVVPALDEEAGIASTLARLGNARARGAEVIVADGGSRDATAAIAGRFADRVIVAPRGRASQMNAGAAAARGQVLLFLHADSLPPDDFDRLVLDAIGTRSEAWGRFDVRIVGGSPMLAVVAAMMNLRSRLTGIATGDQGIFVTRALFDAAGGFPAQPLMEDIALSRTLKRRMRPLCLAGPIATSGRRWERHGIARTIVLMWRLRLAYYFGADPADLARRYDPGHRR